MSISTFCPDGKYHSMHQPRCQICTIETLTAELENRKKQFDDYAAAEEINNAELQKEIDEVWDTLGLAEYDGEDSASHFIEGLQRAVEKHKADSEMHRKANESLSAALRNVRLQMQNVEEKEAACCPEDVGFDEYIRTLKQLLADKNTTANTTMKANGWCYASSELAETYTGPFPTRDEAIAEGFAEYEHQDSIAVAEAIYPNPIAEICAALPLDFVLETLEERAEDGEWWANDDALFVLKGNRDTATAELAVALGSWADRFLEPQSFTARNVETVRR